MTTHEQEKALGSDTFDKLNSLDHNSDLPTQTSDTLESTGDQSAILTDPSSSKEAGPNEPPPTDLPEPPNGGIGAWTQCLGTFCLWFAVWGLVNSSGA